MPFYEKSGFSDVEPKIGKNDLMPGFVVTSERSSRPLEKVGWFRVEGDTVVMYLEGLDRIQSGKPR